MIPEIGTFALVVALCLSLLQFTLPMVGATWNISPLMNTGKSMAIGQLVFVSIAYACLTWSFISHDFSVVYVAHNSNLDLPFLYRVSGVWGAHEGSLLLWLLILAGWSGAVAFFSRGVPLQMIARVISVLGLISVGFSLFLLVTSNPFERQFPVPYNGHDLNPLLQDPGLAIHPPMLYLGYVGFSVTFAFAIAALISGRLDAAWARWSRIWTILSWVFLTIGITLGSWWAYNELGWGGWWFWDPVENASFIPWLVGTALIHSLAATEKRGVFKAWTVLLAIFVFSLSLLGTFLVRSGILTSVHAFATDPTRGIFILIFLGIIVGGSLLLYAWRAPAIRSSGDFDLISRETALLLNNVLLVVTAATILIGTLYPLLLESLDLGKISVGPPYFNTVFIPLIIPLVLLSGIGALSRWRQDRFDRIARILWAPFTASFIAGGLWPLLGTPHYSISAALGSWIGIWAIFSAFYGIWIRTVKDRRISTLRAIPRSIYGMTLAHSGVGIFIIGIAFASAYTFEKDVRMAPGDEVNLSGYRYRFDGVAQREGPNYRSSIGTITVFQGQKEVAHLYPEKRTYAVQSNPMTEAGIDAGLFRDLYAVLGEPLEAEVWSLRLYYNAFIRWVWLGPLIMGLGGLLSVSDRRYRRLKPCQTANTTPDIPEKLV